MNLIKYILDCFKEGLIVILGVFAALLALVFIMFLGFGIPGLIMTETGLSNTTNIIIVMLYFSFGFGFCIKMEGK